MLMFNYVINCLMVNGSFKMSRFKYVWTVLDNKELGRKMSKLVNEMEWNLYLVFLFNLLLGRMQGKDHCVLLRHFSFP